MTSWQGYVGQLLRIDLSSGSFGKEPLKREDLDKFLGGVGLSAKIIADEVPTNTPPFDPANKVVFMTGPLTGTVVPGSARYVVCAKSPLTDAWGESHAGGFWGPELKSAGYDGLVIEGKADAPVYVWIHDEDAELKSAQGVWGKSCPEADQLIKNELGDDRVKTACIGPAGEKLVRFASIINDACRAAGRCGLGAVMGSKNLKAVAVRGSGKISIAQMEKLRSVIRRTYPLIMSSPTVQYQAAYGTNGEMEVFHEYGDVPIKHFTKGLWEGVEKISGEAMAKAIVKGQRACFNCPVACWRHVKVEKGPYAGVVGRGPEYETCAALGTLLLNDNLESIAKANELCNEYGLDTISTGVAIAFAMECVERGLITDDDTGGVGLKWGDHHAVLDLVKLIGERRGIGRLLGEGVRRASKTIGGEAEKYAMHVKGLEMPMHDSRAFKGMGLQYATSQRGACHLQGLVLRLEQGERMTDLKIYERLDRFETKGKGRVVAIMQDWYQIFECMGLCKFVTIPPGYVAGFYSMATGMETSIPKLLEIGERISNLVRLFNVGCGISRKDDTLPARFLQEPLDEGGAKGQVVELGGMLEEYYEHRGWNAEGVPSSQTLRRLAIDWPLSTSTAKDPR